MRLHTARTLFVASFLPVATLSAVVQPLRFSHVIIGDAPSAWKRAGFQVSPCSTGVPSACQGEICLGPTFRIILVGRSSGAGTVGYALERGWNSPFLIDIGGVSLQNNASVFACSSAASSHPNGVTKLMKIVHLPYNINSTINRAREQGALPRPLLGPRRDPKTGVTYALWRTLAQQMEYYEMANVPEVEGRVLKNGERQSVYYLFITPSLQQTRSALKASGLGCGKPSRYLGRWKLGCDVTSAGVTAPLEFILPSPVRRPKGRQPSRRKQAVKL